MGMKSHKFQPRRGSSPTKHNQFLRLGSCLNEPQACGLTSLHGLQYLLNILFAVVRVPRNTINSYLTPLISSQNPQNLLRNPRLPIRISHFLKSIQ